MTSKEQAQVQQIKCQTAKQYGLSETQADEVFNIALGDYLLIKYPCDINRPTPDELIYDFIVLHWLSARMADICDRAGVPRGVKRYSENNLSFEFSSSGIDNGLIDMLMPRGAVPK
jgi:hypothetical protein